MDFCAHVCGHLLQIELQKNSNKNIVVSPLSFNSVLNMIAAGATGNTLQQMLSFLGFNNLNDLKSTFSQMMNVATCKSNGGPEVNLVNGVWVDRRFPLTDSYRLFVQNFCKGEARNVDFANEADQVVFEANLWAKTETRGLITDILNRGDLTPDLICLLGNALYFKGAWRDKFDPNDTQISIFYLLNGGKMPAPLMRRCSYYPYGSFGDLQVVKIPYQGGDNKEFAMYIFLPNEIHGLGDLLQKVNSNPSFFTQNFMLQNVKVDLSIPKFKFKYMTYQGREIMMKTGLTLPFNEHCQELTEMVDVNIPFYFSKIVQKAFIEVDEKGIEAAAVTMTCGFGRYTPPTLPIRFIADHPFMFMIREESSGLVLFTGALINPCLQF